MSFNPGELTDKFGQKVGEYAAAHFSRGEGGFLADAQNKFLREQVGSYVTDQVNQVFHITPSSHATTGTKHKDTDPIPKDQDKDEGGFIGGVKDYANHFFHKQPSSHEISGTLHKESDPIPKNKDKDKDQGGFFNQIFRSDDGPTEDHIPHDQRIRPGAPQSGGNYPQNQGFAPPSGDHPGQHLPPNQGYAPQIGGNYPPNQGFAPPSDGYSGQYIPPNQGYNQGAPQSGGNYPQNQGFAPQSGGYPGQFIPPNQGYAPQSGGNYPPNQRFDQGTAYNGGEHIPSNIRAGQGYEQQQGGYG